MRGKWMGRMSVAAIVGSWVLPISVLVNRIVPEPYMDEIFHIPQAQQYCKGNFKSWDPMITTPPGLYCLSLIHVACSFPAMWATRRHVSFSESCSTIILRSTNGVLAVICSVLIFDIITQLRPAMSLRRAVVFTTLLSLYPIHWFFTFLYYTDVASLTAVLAMYLACLKRHHWLSGMFGSLSIFIRQTNVIWMLFIATNGAIDYITVLTKKGHGRPDESSMSSEEKAALVNEKNELVSSDLRKRKSYTSVNTEDIPLSKLRFFSLGCNSGLVKEFQETLSRMWCLKWKIMGSFSPFILILSAFVVFVILNGSVVLGAKDAHKVSPHFAQLFYFGLVAAAATCPVHFNLSQATSLFQLFCTNKLLHFSMLLLALNAGLFSIHFFSIAHPYLLADNRHYPFYIWRKLNSHWLMKYLLVPLYVYSWLSIFNVLGKTMKKIWLLLFFLACGAVLIPAPLIEFRYYTIPFYFIILHSKIDDNTSWIFLAILYMAANIFTMVIFLFRPFHWDHESGTQRFIW